MLRIFFSLLPVWAGCIFLLSPKSACAQPLSAFVDIQRQLKVWDRGMIRSADYLPPMEYKIGRTTIPFIDNARNFKIYHGGGVKTLNAGFTSRFFPTDNLVAFFNSKSLNVFDRGLVKNLSPLVEQYLIGDSVVLFKDEIRNEYKAYYDGEVFPVENFLAGEALQHAKLSDNIAAYLNFADQFRIFYQGEVVPQEDYHIESFQVGRNTVAYVDANRRFRIFHKGKTFTADNFPPQNYMAGDDLVAFTTTDGYFKIFYDDTVQSIGYFQPEYEVGDNVVAFRDANNFLRVFYKGDLTTLDNYYPEKMRLEYNSLAYVSRTNTLRVFTEGEIYDVTSGSDDWELRYDVLRYSMAPGIFRIFYKGREY